MSGTSRRNLLKGAGVLAGLAGLPTAAGAAPRSAAGGGSHWERPEKQTGNNLNVILLVADTFRADNLAAYGSTWVECPNLNRFAEQAIVFEEAHPEAMPTIPVRRTLITGRRAVTWSTKMSMAPNGAVGVKPDMDPFLQAIFGQAAVATAVVACPRPRRSPWRSGSSPRTTRSRPDSPTPAPARFHTSFPLAAERTPDLT